MPKKETVRELLKIRDSLSQIEMRLEEAKKRLFYHLAGDATEGASGAALCRQMVSDLHELSEATTQEGILSAYLEAARQYLDRAVLFLKEDGRYLPWKARGLDVAGVDPVDGDDVGHLLVRSALDGEIVVAEAGLIETFPWLGSAGEVPAVAVCVPLVFGDAVPVILYGDAAQSAEPEALELLTQMAILLLKCHSLSGSPGPQGRGVAAERPDAPREERAGVEVEASSQRPPQEEAPPDEAAPAGAPDAVETPIHQPPAASPAGETQSASAFQEDPAASPSPEPAKAQDPSPETVVREGTAPLEQEGEAPLRLEPNPVAPEKEIQEAGPSTQDWIPSGIGEIHHAPSMAEDLPGSSAHRVEKGKEESD